jgi:hypothetical protein
MTDLSKEEERALSRDELELVSTARQPALGALDDRALGDLIARLRERRDRARAMADRQRREMRGKAAPSGATAAADNAGTRSKEHFLGAALARAMQERERRQLTGGEMADEGTGESQQDIAEKALAMKREAEEAEPDHPDPGAPADEGMQPNPNEGIAPSGAFDAEGHKVVVERSRKVR